MIKHTLAALGIALAIPALAAPAPNIVLMLVDDLGWQDVKCHDIDAPSPMETPNLDALAKRGVLFRDGYSAAPTCSPSRCAIMSGNHPARAQKTHVVGGEPPGAAVNATLVTPWYSGRMPENELTLAKILRQHGYATGHAGKWHMAKDHYSFPGPLDQGFDFTSHRSGFDARGVQSGMKNRIKDFATDQPKDPYRLNAEGFPADPVTTAALEFMETNKAKPFFLYYATWLVHTPIQTRSKALLEKYCQKLGVDVMDCSSGGIGGSATGSKRVPRGYGFQIPYAAQIRRELGMKSMAVGLIIGPHQAEAALAAGDADLIAVGREGMNNPNWPLHARAVLEPGTTEEVFGCWPPQHGWWMEKRGAVLNALGTPPA